MDIIQVPMFVKGKRTLVAMPIVPPHEVLEAEAMALGISDAPCTENDWVRFMMPIPTDGSTATTEHAIQCRCIWMG